MLTLKGISYLHSDGVLLFQNIHLTVNSPAKVALIGNNGSGKSTLLKIIAGQIKPSAGHVEKDESPYYVPQIFGQYNHLTVARALGIHEKLTALNAILSGEVSEENIATLNDDWLIEDRSLHALHHWGLSNITLSQKLGSLSGGQKTRVILAGIDIHSPKWVLLDEPSNHLDSIGRELLYDFIKSTGANLIIVSHDKQLLSLLHTTCELSQNGIKTYGGNYEFYATQKQIETAAHEQSLQNKEKALRNAKLKEQETKERQQKLDSRGKRKQEKSGVATIMMNTLRNSAENSTAKLKSVHAEKIGGITQDLQTLRSALPEIGKMKFEFSDSTLHNGKILFTATKINYQVQNHLLWPVDQEIEIRSGSRILINGKNGAGKTTLAKIILGQLIPTSGTVSTPTSSFVYIDQDYSIINDSRSVFQQAQQFNNSGLQEHEINIQLSRFLFDKHDWNKKCSQLSGGEKMRLMLCCITINSQAPDIIVLDEPTNNLDIQNVNILTKAILEYTGTLIVISHDKSFLDEININTIIEL